MTYIISRAKIRRCGGNKVSAGSLYDGFNAFGVTDATNNQ
jgi:hypothetical protein